MNLLLMLGTMAILQIRPGQPAPGGADAAGGFAGMLCSCACPLIFLGIGVVAMVGMCKVFAKAGQPAWAALVPIYNTYVLCQIVKKPDWFIMTLIPCINIYFGVMLCIETAKAFGKETGFAIGLLLLPLVFWPMLGFGDAQYQYGRGGRKRKQLDEDEEEEDEEEDEPKPRRASRARDEDEDEEEEDRPRPRRRPRDDDDD
jgi:hypothetical protein